MMNIFRSANRDLYEQHLTRVSRDIVILYSKKVFGDLSVSEEDKEIMLRFFQCELMGQVLLWLESDMRYDIQKQFARLCELLRGVPEEMIRRCERGSK